jgi:serine O-acetyltransferase
MNGDELPFESGFEVYAKGTHKSEFDSNLLDPRSDPIWDAIREEAKLEVSLKF